MTARWLLLFALSAVAVVALLLSRIPAALLIGPMAAAILLAGTGRPLRVPPPLFLAAQGVIGIMIARVFTIALFAEAARQWPLFLTAVVAVLAAACLIGFALTRLRVLPGTSALWGAFPGAATTMVLMAGDFGADIRLVAFMQYLRVVLVALLASATARFAGPASTQSGGLDGTLHAALVGGSIHLASLAATLVVAAAGAVAGVRLRVPAGALLGPMVFGVVMQNLGWLSLELPAPLLAISYAVVGWAIGARFDRDAITAAAHALPRVAAALLALIGACALLSMALARFAGLDPLTAYLAMSPGGADSVAIIAASTPRVDMAFVMALQVARFLVILLCGPALARLVARWAEPEGIRSDNESGAQ